MRYLYAALFLLLTLPAFGQGSVYSTVVQNRNGQPIAGASVAVCITNPGSTPAVPPNCALAPTYSDITVATKCVAASGNLNGPGCANPGVTDAYGNAIIYTTPNIYWLEIYSAQITPYAFAIAVPSTAGGGGTSLQLQVNGVPNGSQTLLNLIAGSNVSLSDNSLGGITISASTGGAGGISGTLTQNFIPKASSTGTNPAVQNSVMAEVSGNVGSPRIEQTRYADSLNWTPQSPSGSLTGGTPATVTLTPCPVGIIGSDTKSYVYIAGTGTPEAVKLTGGGNCTSGGTSGTITFTPKNSHTNGYTVQSASQGIQEALNDAGFASPNGHVVLSATPGASNSFVVRGPVTPQLDNIYIDASGAVIDCETTSTCFNFDGSVVVREFANARFATNQTLASAAITNTACSSSVSTITVPNSFAAGDRVDIQNSFNPHYWGVHTVATASGSQFTYADTNCGGATTIASQASAGGVSWEQAIVEDNTQGLTLRGLTFTRPAGFSGYFNNFIVVDNDQAFNFEDSTTDGSLGHCNATYCSNALYAPGPFSVNAAVVHMRNDNISLQCSGNGIRYYGGNTLGISDSIVQGYPEFGVTGGSTGGLGPTRLDNVYQEVGNCTNPIYGGSLNATAGALVQGMQFHVTAGEGPQGFFPTFTGAGTGGPTQKNYWVIIKDSVLGTSRPLLIGQATPTGGGSLTVSWPRVQGSNTITYDLLQTLGVGTNIVAPNGTANQAVNGATNIAQCSTLLCQFTDTQASLQPYTVAAAGYVPQLWFWPGNVVLSPPQDNGTPSVWYTDYYAGGAVSTATDHSNGALNNFTSVYAKECFPGPVGSPLLVSCDQYDPDTATGKVGARTLRHGINGGSVGGLKGPFILETPTSLYSIPATHLFTLGDCNPEKTLATSGNNPTNDACDTWIGLDQQSNQNPSGYQLAFGAPVSISSYINNVGNGSPLETLTSSTKTFSVGTLNVGNATTVDFHGGAHTAPLKVGSLASAPVPCIDGEQYFATDQATGTWLYGCKGNVWSAEGSGGGGFVPPGGGFQVLMSNGGSAVVATGFSCSDSACDTLQIPGAISSSQSMPWNLVGVFPTSTQMSVAPANQSRLGFGLTNGKLVLSANGGTVAEVPQRGDINLADIKLDGNGCSAFTSVTLCNPATGVFGVQNGSSGARFNVYGHFTSSTNCDDATVTWVPANTAYFFGTDHCSGGGSYFAQQFGTQGSANPQWTISAGTTPGIFGPVGGAPNPDIGTQANPLRSLYVGQASGGINDAGDYSVQYTTNTSGTRVGHLVSASNNNPVQAILATAGTYLTGVVSRGATLGATAGSGSLVNAQIISGGSAWTSNPSCSFPAPPAGGTQAQCTATESGGAINAFTITVAGQGYTGIVSPTLTGGGGSGAILLVDTQLTTGFSMVAEGGIAPCLFDGAATIRDWVIQSTIVADQCHDSGIPAAQPQPMGALGVLAVTNANAGYDNMIFIPYRQPALSFHLNSNSCTTGNTVGANCTTVIAFPGGLTWPDTNYRAVCSGSGVSSGVPVMGAVVSKAAGQFQQTVVATTAAAAKFTDIDCIVTHD